MTTANGAYSWDIFVPLATKSGSMAVRAVDTKGAGTASGTLTIRGFNDNRVPATKVQGDNQTGPAGRAAAAGAAGGVARCRGRSGGGRRGDLRSFQRRAACPPPPR